MIVREMTARDRRYVVPTWARSSRYDGLRLPERFALVDRILDGGARCVVLATDDRTVHAWACADTYEGVRKWSPDGEFPLLLHYAYVPPELRGNGLARRLITELLGEYPDRIHVTHEWPRVSSRFRLSLYRLRAA